MKPELKKLSEKTTKPERLSVTQYVEQLAIAMGTQITKERIGFYVKGLSDLTSDQLSFAFERALRVCKFFPQIAELREFGEAWRPKIDETRAILTRDDKPPTWEPATEEEIAQIVAEVRKVADAHTMR